MRLKTLVLSGRFAPGQRLAEERLSGDLGISRTPIREALHKLQSEGLITSLPTRGFAAPRDSQADTEEINDLRAVLEGYALRVICGRLTEHQLRGLERIVRRTEDAVESQRLSDISRWNARFHNALHSLISDKRRIYQQLVTMRQYAFRYGEGAQSELDAGRRTVEGHRRILTALRLRDPDLCECAMREHIRHSPGDCPRREREPFQRRAGRDRLDRGTDILRSR
jgi:DNA-binding GntR family transcriptional regulator